MGPVTVYLRPRSTHPPVGNPFRCGRRHTVPPIHLNTAYFLIAGTHYCDEL
jgi:hypothetical protein